MKYLAEQLEHTKPNKRCWIDQDLGDIYSYQIAYALSSADVGLFFGRNVGLGKLSQVELAMSMLFLDGIAESITLLPDEDREKSSSPADANLDIILENEGVGFTVILNNTKPENIQISSIIRTNNTKWILSTSGTTGVPKKIKHDLSSLTRTVKISKPGETLLWGSFYNMKRFAGLQVFFQSWLGGDELVLTDNHGNAKEVLSKLIEARCNALSATPSMWRNISMLPNFKNLNLKQITLGGEIADQSILDILRREFPQSRITHIYASTEAGVGFAVNDGQPGFPVEYLSVPPKNNKLKIGQNGNLYILPASIVNEDILTKEWIDTGDAVCIKGDRVLFMGRSNGSINVGGNKVMPEEIESVIYELDSISFVQVRGRKSSILGNIVEAAITPSHGVKVDAILKKSVIDHCRRKLDGYKVPAIIVEAEKPTINSAGKLLRSQVNE